MSIRRIRAYERLMIMRNAMRWSTCVLTCLLIAGGAFAEDSYAIFGTISDSSGAALQGARVNVSGWLEAQVTDADGAFRVEGAQPEQTYEVTASLPGYIFKPAKRVVLIGSGDERANFVGRVADDGTVGMMSVTPVAAPPPASKAGPDAYEADNNWGMASGIGRHETQTHNIHANWDLDWVTFTLPWRANVDIETAGTVGGDTNVWLYGPDDHTLLVDFDDDSGNGAFSHISNPPYVVLGPGRYWIRVQEDGQDATINSYSLSLDANEASPARLIYPNAAGISWDLGSDQTIRWTGLDGDRAALVLLKDGERAATISADTPNDGQFVWRVDPDIEPGTDYRVGIMTDAEDNETAWSDNEFEIVSVPLVTYPSDAGISFARGTEVTIEWQGFTGPNVRIDLFKGGVLFDDIEASTNNDGSWSDYIPPDLPPATNYKIKITSVAHPAENDMSNHNFAIVANSRVIYPSDEGIVWRRDASYAITWYDFTSPTVRIELFDGGTLDRTLTTGTPNDGTFWWHVPADMPIGEDYKIRVSDPAKAPDDDMSDFPFAVSLPPKVLFPSAPGIEIGRGTNMEITWRGYSGTHVKIDIYKGGVLGGDIVAITPNDGSYTVYTPDDAEIRDDYRIEVTSLAYPTETDQSNNDFAVVANPRVTNPTVAGITWEIGEVVTINWADFGGAQVRIQLYKGTSVNRTITRGTANDGSFVWRVPPDQDRGDDFRVRVVRGDDWGEFDFSNNHFTIAPTPVVVYPSAKHITWRQGGVYHIEWRDFPGDNVGIELYHGASVHTVIATNTANDGAFIWRVPNTTIPDDNYRIAIYNTEGPVVEDRSDNQFTIEPGPHVSAPDGGEIWYAGDGAHITWERFPGANVKIRIYRSGALVRTISSNTPNDGSFWWTVPNDLPNAANYLVRINALSDTGQWDHSDNYFTITRRPKVTYPSAPGITFAQSGSMHIQWQNFVGGNVRIVLLKGGAFQQQISATTANDGSFWWSVPGGLALGDDYRIKINSTSHSGLVDRSNNDFEITP